MAGVSAGRRRLRNRSGAHRTGAIWFCGRDSTGVVDRDPCIFEGGSSVCFTPPGLAWPGPRTSSRSPVAPGRRRRRPDRRRSPRRPARPDRGARAAADATTTLRVGTLVFANDYRHPALLAKEAATVDRLSGGRLEFGLGAGWMTTDYTATGIPLDPPSVRIARLEEALEVIRALWSGEPVEHHGRFYDISGLVGTPTRPSNHPPIVIGGGGPARCSRWPADTRTSSTSTRRFPPG